MRTTTAALPALVLIALAAAPAGAGWGRDINQGQGAVVDGEARPGLLSILEASASDRRAAVAAFAEKAGATCEAWKRYRNPEFRPLFLRLTEDADWTTAHRALFALEKYGGDDVLQAAWKLLFHSERRLREKAAVTCIKTWSARGAKECSQGDWKGALASLLDTEPDPHVRRCLEALQRRAAGKLPMRAVHEEFTVKDKKGLLFTPFLSGMNTAKSVAPGYAAKGTSQGGGGSALKLPVAPAWTTPVLGYGDEVVKGTSLQPFANPRENGVVHTGQDFGACMDGAGYYAAAAGVVKFIHSGSDMGTLLVLEHHLDRKRTVCAVYMHGGDTVFVKGGEKVVAGQLLGTMGMGYSLENGGHFAHLHFGLYPGPFQSNHNYGYKKKSAGLLDWLDPARCLPLWGDMGAVTAEEEPAAVAARAARVRAAGYPTRAKEILEEGKKALKGKDGVDLLGETLAGWKKDPRFSKGVKGESKLLALELAFWGTRSSADLVEQRAAALAALRPAFADSDLAPRLK